MLQDEIEDWPVDYGGLSVDYGGEVAIDEIPAKFADKLRMRVSGKFGRFLNFRETRLRWAGI